VSEETTKRGLVFPSEDHIPEEHYWYRMDFGDDTQWDLTSEGCLQAAREAGLVSVQSRVEDSGTSDGLLYATASATLKFDDGAEWTAVSGADETSQQVRDPEHVWSVAETRAIKRAVKRAVPIRPADVSRDPDASSPAEDDDSTPTPTNKPDDAPDDPPSEW
jgi:hypothetical protein